LCGERRLATANRDVVAIEGDVDGAERGLDSGALVDQAREPPREWDPAGLDPDECQVVELWIALDDLVGDSRKGSLEPVGVEERFPPKIVRPGSVGSAGGASCPSRGVRVHRTPFRPRWTGLKGFVLRAA
jgi:hypothetical protein